MNIIFNVDCIINCCIGPILLLLYYAVVDMLHKKKKDWWLRIKLDSIIHLYKI